MINYKTAIKILTNSKIKIKNEKVNCLESLNMICAENIYFFATDTFYLGTHTESCSIFHTGAWF